MRVADDVLEVLSRAELDGQALRLIGQLDRAMYTKVNKVLDAAGGKWSRSAKAHIFDRPASDRVDEIILTGEVEVPKDEFNYFPSPPAVVARLIELADLHEGMRVLEPSAGKGAIAFACVEHSAAEVDCFELMEDNYNSLSNSEALRSVCWMDFLDVPPVPVYDRVVMNPPFAKQQDIKHVLHALKFLKPEGLLVSVMASSVTFRDNKLTQDFRDLIRERGGEIEALPEGAFRQSGTMVRTVIVTIPGGAA
jgi:predicted RNA methylase